MTPVRVLYLAGSGRSGSTLITTVLGQLDGVFAAGELRYLWQRGMMENRPCGCGAPFAECPLWSAVVAELFGVDPARIAAGLRGRLRMRGLPGLLRRHRAGARPVAPHPDDDAIAALYAAVARHAGPVIVDSSKLPPYGALLGALPGVELRVLHVVRDPRATAFSWRRRRGLDGTDDDRLMSRPPVWKAALLWLVWNGATLRLWAGRPDRYLRVRYEDFVAAPAETTRRIARFAGLAPAALPFTAAGTVRLAPTHSVAGNPSRHRVGAVAITDDAEWRRALSRRAYAVVTALTAPLLRRFGYPVRRAPHPVGRAARPEEE
ncbi:Sulfotransferase family protein [Micromonospora pattaloongensis]|uniref:Sulfotransferase family protein n=1 Tax=Micromonospora pattaloongensis TaxID=405436 RepID=A0A1H3RG77_9ACTN|nr:sulfotransferase [Micromonospora pattaloongensis]SDZ24640.1 Sulfotransferase family protein [Micromonospora pattaloongensis]